jgi:hypothetical protein
MVHRNFRAIAVGALSATLFFLAVITAVPSVAVADGRAVACGNTQCKGLHDCEWVNGTYCSIAHDGTSCTTTICGAGGGGDLPGGGN